MLVVYLGIWGRLCNIDFRSLCGFWVGCLCGLRLWVLVVCVRFGEFCGICVGGRKWRVWWFSGVCIMCFSSTDGVWLGVSFLYCVGLVVGFWCSVWD